MAALEPDKKSSAQELPALVIPLLKGVIYREADAGQWNALLSLQARVRDLWP